MTFTAFLPAARATDVEIQRQHETLSSLPYVRGILDAMPSMAVVLNAERQIVMANRAFTEYLARADAETQGAMSFVLADAQLSAAALGQRPGEVLGCTHACETDGGCGTTPFCRTCGAANALKTAVEQQSRDVRECRILRADEHGGGALDLRVWAQPLDVEDEHFTVFAVVDISHEKRREALERIFFHDVMNTAGGVKGLAQLIADHEMPVDEVRRAASLMMQSADQLFDEIGAQRELVAAEAGDLRPSESLLDAPQLLSHVLDLLRSHRVARGRELQLAEGITAVAVRSDPVLLRRVLLNLVKNALEAEPAGGTVTVGVHAEGDGALFSVHNTRAMPPEVQMQVFQRSFSTKGEGRGLGTYSVRLLTERYLGGRVSFVSSADEGTTFTVQLPERLPAPKRPPLSGA